MKPPRRVVERLVEAGLKRVQSFTVELDDPLLDRLADELAARIAVFDGTSYYCSLCSRGPFTRKGIYLHAKTVHWDELTAMAYELLENTAPGCKH